MGIGRDIAYAAGALVTAPVWGAAMLRTGKWRTDWAGRFGRGEEVEPKPQGTKRVLIHAVSVGEVNLVRNLVDELAQREPAVQVVVSTTTNTGFARATALFGGRHAVVRYPFDFSGAVRRFFDRVRPDVVALVELELWPNFMEEATRRGVPVCVINGRLSERSFRNYRKARPLLRRTFARLAAVAAQTPAYAQRFVEMGVPNERVRVLDTMKWDTAQVADPRDVAGVDELAVEMGIDRSRPVVVLGSTGEGEEDLLISAMPEALRQRGVQLVIVPRKPERFDEVAARFPGITRRSAGGAAQAGQTMFLLDTLGELRKAYALADVVVVGRSFNGWGGSDPIESVALGRATIVGPDHQNFADAVAALSGGGGLRVAKDPAEAWEMVLELLDDLAGREEYARRGRDVILSRQGSTARHAQMVLELLAAAEKQP